MRAAVFEREGVLKIKEIPKPEIIRADDVIIKVELCSICGTDVHIMSVPPGYEATPGTVLGHEICGEIVEIGSAVTTVKPGDRVVLNPNDYCGTCDYCKNNYPNFCEHIRAMGIDVDGGFAEFVRTSEKTVYRISPALPARIAAFAEPLACLLNGFQKIRVMPGESAVVIGAGTIGLMFVQMMKAAGAYPIIGSDPNERKRALAKKCGADITVNPLEQSLEEVVHSQVPMGADYCAEVVGSQMRQAVNVVRKGGTVLLFGVNKKAECQIAQSRITQNEIAVRGTWLANATFPRAVRLLESGVLHLEELITHTLPLEGILEGIELMKTGEGVEILIDPCLQEENK